MGRDKTTQQGIGPDVEEPSGPPSSGARESDQSAVDSRVVSPPRGKRPGSEAPRTKTVTKVGVAPPSNRPPLVEPLSAEFAVGQFDEETLTAKLSVSDLTEGSEPDSQIFDETREELTPVESSRESDPGDRSQFRTAPGGGKNRISGGRAAASAYVSPKTLPPGHGKDHVTAAVKVLKTVKEEAQTFQTEPSLLRRRASSLPPPISLKKRERRLRLVGVIALITLLTILVAVVLVWILNSRGEDDPALEDRSITSTSSEVPAPVPDEKKRRPNQAEVNPPRIEKEHNPNGPARSPHPTTKPLSPVGGKSLNSTKVGSVPKTKPPPPPPTGPKPSVTAPEPAPQKPDDLWLE